MQSIRPFKTVSSVSRTTRNQFGSIWAIYRRVTWMACIPSTIEFCKPVYIKQWNKRSTVKHISSITQFVCLATKAIYFELVGELSTGVFLDAFDRFVSRRRNPITVWADNGKSLFGAAIQLESRRTPSTASTIETAFNEPMATSSSGDSTSQAHYNSAVSGSQTFGRPNHYWSSTPQEQRYPSKTCRQLSHVAKPS